MSTEKCKMCLEVLKPCICDSFWANLREERISEKKVIWKWFHLGKKMGFGDMEEKINQNNSSSSYKENESSNEINIWELIMKPT